MLFANHDLSGTPAWTQTEFVSLDAHVEVPAGAFDHCAVIFMSQCIGSQRWDHKFFLAPGVGFIKIEAWNDGAPCDKAPALLSSTQAKHVGARAPGTVACDPS